MDFYVLKRRFDDFYPEKAKHNLFYVGGINKAAKLEIIHYLT